MQTATHGTLLEEGRFDELVHRLTRLQEDDGVLSVYLDIDPATAGRQGYEARLIELWKPLKLREMNTWMRGRLEYEISGVMEEVRSWKEAPGRSVVMFFSGPAGLRIVQPLRVPVHSVARFEPRAALAPLIAALDQHHRYCVVMFDKAQARIMTVLLGRVEEEVHLESDVLPRTDVGGWGGYLQSSYARHREHHLTQHAHRVIEHLWAIERSRPIHSLILAGPEEAVASLQRMLPKALARSVVGRAALDLDVSTPEVLKHVAHLDAEGQARDDEALASEIQTAAAKGGAASLGWDETLAALCEGRVHLLALATETAKAGVECASGHFLSVTPAERCPVCGASTATTADIGEVAVRVGLLSDAQVRVLREGALGTNEVGAELRW